MGEEPVELRDGHGDGGEAFTFLNISFLTYNDENSRIWIRIRVYANMSRIRNTGSNSTRTSGRGTCRALRWAWRRGRGFYFLKHFFFRYNDENSRIRIRIRLQIYTKVSWIRNTGSRVPVTQQRQDMGEEPVEL